MFHLSFTQRNSNWVVFCIWTIVGNESSDSIERLWQIIDWCLQMDGGSSLIEQQELSNTNMWLNENSEMISANERNTSLDKLLRKISYFLSLLSFANCCNPSFCTSCFANHKYARLLGRMGKCMHIHFLR